MYITNENDCILYAFVKPMHVGESGQLVLTPKSYWISDGAIIDIEFTGLENIENYLQKLGIHHLMDSTYELVSWNKNYILELNKHLKTIGLEHSVDMQKVINQY
jgi:hypothetical protein